MGNRLKWAREKAGYPSARQAALKLNLPPSTYSAHENGQNDFHTEDAELYGKAYKVRPAWLLTGEGSADTSEQPKKGAGLPVMGKVGGGSVILPEYDQVPPDGLYQVDLPYLLSEDLIAFEIEGPSMLPYYQPGDLVVVYKEQRRGTESFIGKEAAVRTEDGHRYLKTIVNGPRRGLYSLQSFNAMLIEGVEIAWVGEIYGTIRGDALRRIERAQQRRNSPDPARPRMSR